MGQALAYPPHAVGSLRRWFPGAGQALPAPLSTPSQPWGFALREEIGALPAPMVVTMDARSTTTLTIALAAARSADTGRAPGAALEEHPGARLGLASDRGLGLVAGSHAACAMAWWGWDACHAWRALGTLRHPWQRHASAALGPEDEAAPTLARATSAAPLAPRLPQAATAHHACAHALARDDPLALRLPWLRATFPRGAPPGRRRTVEGVRSARTRLVPLSAALDGAALAHPRQPIPQPRDAMVVPWAPAAAMAAARRAVVPHDACDVLVLAWHPAPLFSPSPAPPKRDQHSAREGWLAGAAGRLAEAWETRTALGGATLDALGRASSLVEMGQARLRPSLRRCTGHSPQEA